MLVILCVAFTFAIGLIVQLFGGHFCIEEGLQIVATLPFAGLLISKITHKFNLRVHN